MADGRPRSNTSTQTCQVQPLVQTLRLFPPESSASSRSIPPAPANSTPGKEPDPATVHNLTTEVGLPRAEPSGQSTTLQSASDSHDHEIHRERNELSEMLE